MIRTTRRRLAYFAVASLLACARLQAHDVVVEQVVRMVVEPQADGLVVRLQVPVSLLNDAGLPRLDGGNVDPSTSQAALQVVATDVARNLDFRQGRTVLKVARATARPGLDGHSVDVEIAYAVAGQPIGFSARVNAFQGTPLQPPRTDVSFQQSAGRPQLLTVTGPPTRLVFDPGAVEVTEQFLARAFDAVLAIGSHLLFLICLLVPRRRALESARLVATMLTAQAAGIILSATLSPTSAALLPVGMIAWSAVVIAALCGIASSNVQTVAMLCGVFGLLSGVEFGAALNVSRQLAGAHGAMALLTFTLVALVAEAWLAAVMWATRRWLDSVVRSDRAATAIASALVAHIALHHVFDRGHEIAQSGSFVAGHAVTLLVLGWTLVMMGLALSRFMRGLPPLGDRRMSDRAPV